MGRATIAAAVFAGHRDARAFGETLDAHTAMHGMTFGRLAGVWLAGADSVDGIVTSILEEVRPEPLTFPYGDFGS